MSQEKEVEAERMNLARTVYAISASRTEPRPERREWFDAGFKAGVADRAAQQVQADAGVVAEHIEWCHQTMREAGFCIDGGKCHRGCAPTDACSRQDDCVPLSGSKLAANWNLPCAHPSPAEESDKRDAERWRTALRFVGAYVSGGFHLDHMPTPAGVNLMRGSVAEHFTSAVDAMSREQSQENGGQRG